MIDSPNLKLIKKCGRYRNFSDSKSGYFCEFIHCLLKARNAQATLAVKSKMKINSLNKQKTWITY